MATYNPRYPTGLTYTGGSTNGYWPPSGTAVQNAWSIWNSTGTSLTTSQIWGNWTTTGATTTTLNYATDQLVWQNWFNKHNAWFNQPALTAEELAALEEQRRVQLAQAEERAAKERVDAAEAEKRAEDLLCSQLRPGQRRMLRERRHFYVRSQLGRRYEIERGHHGNVYEVDGKGTRIQSFCIYAKGGVPAADSMLAQKLHLEMNEEHFLSVAHPYALPRR